MRPTAAVVSAAPVRGQLAGERSARAAAGDETARQRDGWPAHAAAGCSGRGDATRATYRTARRRHTRAGWPRKRPRRDALCRGPGWPPARRATAGRRAASGRGRWPRARRRGTARARTGAPLGTAGGGGTLQKAGGRSSCLEAAGGTVSCSLPRVPALPPIRRRHAAQRVDGPPYSLHCELSPPHLLE